MGLDSRYAVRLEGAHARLAVRRLLAAVVVIGACTAAATPVVASSATSPGPDRADHARSLGAHQPAPVRAIGSAGREAERPNVVVITSDDQALSDMQWMPRTRRVLGDAGVTFTSMLSPHPLCCPARANLLTGQYAQNTGVRSNSDDHLGGFGRLARQHTLPVWLERAGYRTAFVGKYLNGYEQHLNRFGDEPTMREPGWSEWNPIVAGLHRYIGSTFYDNGRRETFADIHSSDVIRRYTGDYIRDLAPGPKPFFLWASHYAPHAACLPGSCWQPAVPASRHAELFGGVRSPSFADPAFNEPDMRDKPPWLRQRPLVPTADVQAHFLGRIRSLQAVDEAVEGAVRALAEVGELDNTVVLFTSDNGLLMGEHRLVAKNHPYEQAMRVPLLVRGPGVPGGTTRPQVVTMVDLAPTILDLAGATADVAVDGRSIRPTFTDARAPGTGTVLIQAGPVNDAQAAGWGWSWRGVRTNRYTYALHADGFEELYDRRDDPAQLRNAARNPAYAATITELRRRTTALGTCAGPACRRRWAPVPPPAPALAALP